MAAMSAPYPPVPIRAFPLINELAEMLCVDPTTLGRHLRGRALDEGARAKRVEPGLALAAAAHYKRVVLNDVAAFLIDYAHEHEPEAAGYVTDVVENFFQPRTDSADRFLHDAQEFLPSELFEAVRIAVEHGRAGVTAGVEGVAVDD